jgi:PIN domain nuclease of toxin-antitoxin system
LTQSANLLFDTQAVISWALEMVPHRVISAVQDGAGVHVSVVSLWEFLLKSRYHEIGISFEEMQQTVKALGAHLLAIEPQHLQTLRTLPFVGDHRDPFDRLIISQAISEGFSLVGKDRGFPQYRKTPVGHQLDVIWE